MKFKSINGKSTVFYKDSLLGIFVLCLSLCLGCTYKKQTENESNTFSYNIPISPQTFDPLLQRGTNSRYLLNHLYITLFKWGKNNQLKPYAAEKCDWQQTHLVCLLKKDLKFQDGTPITAHHFVKSLNLLSENQVNETLNFKTTSYKAQDDHTLVFTTLKKNENLKNKLTLIEISPRKDQMFYKEAESVISSTKYKIKKYVKNQYLVLDQLNAKDLKVKIHFIEDYNTALRLYKTKKLSLLTQLPIREINNYKNSPELFHVHMIRMDGLFFHNKISDSLKKALFHSVNFYDLKHLYKSIGLPGCPPIPTSFYKNNYCYNFDLEKAKDFLKVNTLEDLSKLKLSYSSLGGDDIQRGMEWFAHQWKKNLNIDISIDPLESGLFLQKAKMGQFDIIRKGIPLDSPTCLEGLGSFKKDNPNNIVKFNSKEFDSIVAEIETTSPENTRDLCDKALSILFKNYTYLPLGPMYFSFLENKRFKGWYINSLNVLDIEDLEGL